MTPAIPDEVVKAMPERIYAVKQTEGSNCVVSFDTPSLDYNIEYVRADLALPFLQGVKVKGLDDETMQKLREALRFSASRSVMSSADEDRILSAFETVIPGSAPSPRAQALEEGDNLCSRLEGLASWLDGSQHSKWCGRKEVPIHGFSGEGKLVRSAIAAIRALSSQPVVDGWLPIETAPKDTVVDIWCVHTEHAPSLCRDAKLTNGQWLSGYFEEPLNAGWTPTHWRPLPASPGASE